MTPLSQADAARAIGVSTGTIKHIEEGSHAPVFETVDAYANVLERSALKEVPEVVQSYLAALNELISVREQRSAAIPGERQQALNVRQRRLTERLQHEALAVRRALRLSQATFATWMGVTTRMSFVYAKRPQAISPPTLLYLGRTLAEELGLPTPTGHVLPEAAPLTGRRSAVVRQFHASARALADVQEQLRHATTGERPQLHASAHTLVERLQGLLPAVQQAFGKPRATFARLLGTTSRTLRRYEARRQTPRATHLIQMSRTLARTSERVPLRIPLRRQMSDAQFLQVHAALHASLGRWPSRDEMAARTG